MEQDGEGERDKLLQRDPPGVAIQYGGAENIGEAPRDVPSDVIAEQHVEMSFLVRVIKTMAMASIYICLGWNQGIIGPTMLDLADLLADSRVDVLSRGLMIKAVGILVGSFLGGLIADRLRKQADLWLFIAALLGGMCCAAVPWLQNVTLLAIDMFVQGVAQGLHNVAACSLTIAIWGERAGMPIHFLHTCYTFGLVICQPISGLFVTNHANNSSIPPSLDLAVLPGGGEGLNSYLEDYEKFDVFHGNATRIYIPYGMFGALEVLFSFSFLAFFLGGLTYSSTTVSSKTSWREMLNPATRARGHFGFGLFMLVCLFLLYVGIVMRDNSLGLFLCPTGELVFNMSGFTASLLGLAFSISQFVGRLGATILAICIPVQVLVFVELIGTCFFMIALTIWGLQEKIYLWIFSCAAGLFIGPNYPSIMAWADRYIEATGLVITVIDLGIGIGAFLATLVGGILFRQKGPEWLFYMSVGGAVFMLGVLIPLQIVSSRYGDRHAAESEQNKERGERRADGSDENTPDETSPLIN